MTPLQRTMLESLARKGLTIAGTALITRGIVTQDEFSSWLPELTGLALIGVSQGWAMFASWWQQKILGAALALPAGGTKAEAAEVARRPEAPSASLSAHTGVRTIRP